MILNSCYRVYYNKGARLKLFLKCGALLFIKKTIKIRTDKMHELGIVLHVIDEVEALAKENGVQKVTRLTLEIGEVSTVIPSYFTDCFNWAKKKTEYMKDTELKIETIEAVSFCEDCGCRYKTTEYAKICPECGGVNTYLLPGNETNIKDMEVME